MNAPIPTEVIALLDCQAGVISRSQAITAGLTDHDIRRLVRRREWVRVHTGVYVDHSGPLTWLQRAWAAVLSCAPAALCGESARRAADGPGRSVHDDGHPIHVAVDHSRTVSNPEGVRVHRVVGFATKVQWNTSPPRERIEHAVVSLAGAAVREIDAVAHIADAVGARLTTGRRLQSALNATSRIARRGFLERVIADVAAGTCSALEHGYLTRVERAHRLPTAARQLRESAKGTLFRDAVYELFGLIVELDGRMFHSKARQHDRDLERDLDAALDTRLTVRLGWGQVFDRPCSTAAKLARILRDRGWDGSLKRCDRCPADVDAAA